MYSSGGVYYHHELYSHMSSITSTIHSLFFFPLSPFRIIQDFHQGRRQNRWNEVQDFDWLVPNHASPNFQLVTSTFEDTVAHRVASMEGRDDEERCDYNDKQTATTSVLTDPVGLSGSFEPNISKVESVNTEL